MRIDINPTVDFVFKRLLGDMERPAITVHFLNSFLRPEDPIIEVEILNPILDIDFDQDKLSILDVLARDTTGRVFDIEVQRSVPAGLAERLAYYVATLLVGQIGAGDDYRRLRPTIGICVLDAILFPLVQEYHHDFQLRSQHALRLTDCLQIHLLELRKYPRPDDNRIIIEPMEQWTFFFRYAYGSSVSHLMQRLPHPVFAEALGVLEMVTRSPLERQLYEARLKFERDERARLIAAREDGIKVGLEQGLEQGIEQGIEQGREQGLEQGREQGLERGLEQGMERGMAIGRVASLQRLLGVPGPSVSALRQMTTPELEVLVAELERQVHERFHIQ